MARPIEIKEQVLDYRRKGYSIKELADRFGVAKSTISVWTRNIELEPAALTRLLARTRQGPVTAALAKKSRTDALNRLLLSNIKKDIEGLILTEYYGRLLCAMIYWCEGAKDSGYVKFVNSDPELVRCFIDWIEKYFNTPRAKVRALMHLHEYHDPEKQLSFWAIRLNIERSQFHKSYSKPNTGKRIRHNYPGCIAVNYYDTMLAKQLLFLAKAFLNK
jgi:transposase-like protein